MAMACPQCNRTYEQQLNCPECGVRLLYQAPTRAVAAEDGPVGDGSYWQQTPWGRMAIGLLLAQGLGYGLQQLLTAGFLVTGEGDSIWSTIWGVLLLHGVQGACLLVAGALCGAGKKRGILYGACVGLVNGLIFLMVQRQSGEVLTEIALYGQPVLHMAFGAFGGLIGVVIWKPTPTLALPEGVSDSTPVSVPAPSFDFLSGPVYIGRICLGIFVVVNGVVWSNAILNWVMTASQGALEIRTHVQAQVINWEICALASVVGAGLAGANTFNGVKQGLFVGVGSSLILVGVHLGKQPKETLNATLLMIGTVIGLAIVGGWFGSQLFPPIGAKRRKRIFSE